MPTRRKGRPLTSDRLHIGLEIEHRDTGQIAIVRSVRPSRGGALVTYAVKPVKAQTLITFAALKRDWREAPYPATAAAALDLSRFSFRRFLSERTTADANAADRGPFVIGDQVIFRADHWIEWLAEQGVTGGKIALTAPLYEVLPGLQRRTVKLSTGKFAAALTAKVPAGLDLPVRGRLHGGGFKAPAAPSGPAETAGDFLLAEITEQFACRTPEEQRYLKSRIMRLLRDTPTRRSST